MKRITLLIIAITLSLSLFSQNCVTDFRDEDFGLESFYREIEFMKVDPDSNLWFGLANTLGAGGYGIGKFDGTSWSEFKASNTQLLNDEVYDIAFDTSGYVWVAYKEGLARFNPEDTTDWINYDETDFGTGGSSVSAIAIDSGYVKWLGMASGELIRFNDTTWTIFEDYKPNKINTINIDSLHNIWFGIQASNGLAVYDHEGFTEYFHCDRVNSIQFWDTITYAADLNGLHIFDGAEWQFIADPSFPPPGYSLWDIAINSIGNVWLSSSKGLVELRDTILIPYNFSNSGISDFALFSAPCAFDPEDNLWYSYQYTGAFTYCAIGFLTENAGLGLDILSDKNFVFCEGDSTVLDAGDGFASYIWSTGDISDTLVIKNSDTVHVAVSDGAGCWDYDTVTTLMQEVYEFEKICVVTVINGQNVVVWARTADVGTEYYHVYKETEVADEYELAGTVPFTLISVFVDTNSEAGTRSERYKIAALDSCGNESELSAHHKTMNLTLNVGLGGKTNLIWENYEGFDFGSYIIYRGTRPDNMVEFDTVPSNITTWVDQEIGNFYYKIGVVMPDVCTPAAFLKAGAGPYSHSFSNEESRLNVVPPPTGLTITDSTIFEDQPAGTFIGKLTTIPADTSGYDYTLVAGEGDTGNGMVTISNDSLFSAGVLDYDVEDTISIRIRSTNKLYDTLIIERSLKILVLLRVNNAPTDIALSDTSVDEKLPAGALVGKLTTTDPDAGDTHTYTLVAGAGSADNVSFTIGHDSLLTTTGFDVGTQAIYNIRIRTTDDGTEQKYYEKQFVITVTDVNEAPTDIVLSSDNLDEKLPEGTLVGRFTTTDPDAGDTHTYSLVAGEGSNDNGSFTITGDSLLSAMEFIYATKSSYSIRVRSTDAGSLVYEEQMVIQVNPTGVEQISKDLRIYPVPVTGRLTIEFPYKPGQEYRLIITDLNGRRILAIENIRTDRIEINMSDWEPGVYLLNISGFRSFFSKIVK